MRATSPAIGLLVLLGIGQFELPQAVGVPPLGKIVKKAEENKRNPPKPEQQPPVKRRVLVTISKETTYILGPLRPDGYPDYVAALNVYASKGVTPENNAAVLLWQAFGPKPIDEKARDRFFKKLGIPPLPETGDYFIPFHEYARIVRESQEPAPEHDQGEKDDKQFARAMERPWLKKECPLVAKWLEANERPLKLLLEATKRPRYYAPLVGTTDDTLVMAVLLPTLSPSREAARALKARALFRLQAGKVAEAQADLLACHRLARLMGQGATLVDGLVAISIDGIACSGDRMLGHFGRLGLEQARKVMAKIDQLGPPTRILDKLAPGERFFFLDTVCDIAREGPEKASILTDGGTRQEETIGAALNRWLTNMVVDWDEVLRMGNSFYERLEQAAAKPTHAQRKQAVATLDKECRELARSNRERVWIARREGESLRSVAAQRMGGILLGLLTPAVSAVLTAEERAATNMQLTQLAFPLGAYRTEQGEYPAELAKLVPKYIAELPKDVYTGADFRYRREGKGYVLYSLGPNGKDEGGRGYQMDPPPGEDEEVDAAADDIGFRTPAQR